MEPSDNRLVFFERVPQLQDMAAFTIAVNLTNSSKHLRVIYSGRENEKKVYEKILKDLIIPDVLKGKIQKYVSDCCDEILLPVRCGDYVSFETDNMEVTVEEFLSNIVWKPNGKIDHLKTAFNLVNSAKLEESVKFRVMCQFCMEVKIRLAWFELQDRSFIENQTFQENPLLVYWNCVMTGDFSKIISGNNVGSVEKRVISTLMKIPPNFTAIEYFFSRLNVDDRIEVGAEIKISNDAYQDSITGKFSRFLIPKYTENEQYRLFSTPGCAVRIICVFVHAKSYDSMEDALETWNHIKHFVTSDQYVEILGKLSNCRKHGGDELCEFLTEFLVEFWRTTPGNLKEYVFQPERDEFMLKLCINPYDFHEDYDQLVVRDGRILIAVLSDADLEYRKTFWSREWENIVERSQPSSLKTILNLCLPCDEIIAFKKKATSLSCIREYFIKIIEVGKFSLLNEFLEMLFDGRECEIIDAKKKLFKENINMSYSVECCEQTDESVAAMNDFIKVVFGDDTKAESELKKKIILGCFCVCGGNCNNHAIMYVSERLCEATLLEEVKNQALKKCRRDVDWISSDDDWTELLMWLKKKNQKKAKRIKLGW